MRQGKDDMCVWCRQEFAAARVEPAVARVGLTLRTMPVAARVVGDGAMSAGVHSIDMSAERGRYGSARWRSALSDAAGSTNAGCVSMKLRPAARIRSATRAVARAHHAFWWFACNLAARKLSVQWAGRGVQTAFGEMEVNRRLLAGRYGRAAAESSAGLRRLRADAWRSSDAEYAGGRSCLIPHVPQRPCTAMPHHFVVDGIVGRLIRAAGKQPDLGLRRSQRQYCRNSSSRCGLSMILGPCGLCHPRTWRTIRGCQCR